MTTIRCGECGGEYDEVGFRKNPGGRHTSMPTKLVCILCEQTARDKNKRAYRWRTKARDTRRRHCERYNLKNGATLTPETFGKQFRWDVDRIAHQMEHSYSNGCNECGDLYIEMGHGLSDVTLDIVDPLKSPDYGINTRIICRSCNQRKSKTPPDKWGAKLRYQDEWREQQARLKRNPFACLPLFAGGL